MDDYVQLLIERESIPGISLLVGEREKILLKKQVGYKSVFPGKEPLEENTIYDLASLTKPLVTAFLILYLLERESGFRLDTSVRSIFPGFPFDIEILHLLTHTSGLPGYYPFFLYGGDYFSQLKGLSLESRPGGRVTYSCVGYILLYNIIEKVSGTSFKSFAREVIFRPLGLRDTFLSVPDRVKPRVASTEVGNVEERRRVEGMRGVDSGDFSWREGVIRGETHDCNSWYLGGTAGNAGLFSTVGDIFRISREFFPASASILSARSIGYVWRNFTFFKRSHRTVGFKRNSSFFTSGGWGLSRGAVGHNGFTGTSLWLDPDGDRTFILLTNYVHPVFKPINFDRIRRKLHRLLVKELKSRR